jgi:hypothetical protein
MSTGCAAWGGEKYISCCPPALVVHFAMVILTPFKSFFLLWIWTVTITHPDLKT